MADLQNTFVLGVGAQKAGTTWLHRALSQQPYSEFGIAKEYQVLHAMYEPFAGAKRRDIQMASMAKSSDELSPRATVSAELRASFLENNQLYYDYFESLLKGPAITLVGDITPIYSALSPETLSTVKAEFSARGIEVLPILIMRDPVYRLQSFVRMQMRRKGLAPSYGAEIKRMTEYAGTAPDLRRCDYERIYGSLQKVFGTSFLVFFYETFFTEKSLVKIENAIGESLYNVDVTKRVGASSSQVKLSSDDYLYFRRIYDGIFKFVEKQWPAEVPWKYIP